MRPPDHLVNNTDVALDDLHHLRADILLDVVGNGDAVVTVLVHCDGSVDGL